MEVKYIDYAETRCFSSTVNRLLNHDQTIRPFVNQFPTLSSFEQIIAERNFTGNRNTLVNVLEKQYQQITNQNLLLKQNIQALKAENTYTVTTGHQLNIFTGPLYFIFKIVSAINLAKELKRAFPDKNFVPIYWMATEDHDFDEINHTYIGNKKVSWKMESAGATGRLDTKTIVQALNEYKGVLGVSANAEKLSKIVTAAYTQNERLSDATRYLANELFGEYGLVILDADDRSLKQQFSDVIRRDIIQKNSFQNIQKTNEQLALVGISAQVNPREINFFYLIDGLRERLVFEDGRYQVLNTEIAFSEEELQAEINNFPERFSPNVVMRPLYQEAILPNIAYIGGGGELAYWLQLKSTFAVYGLAFPLLVLRNSAMVVSEHSLKKLRKLNLTFEGVFDPVETLKKKYLNTHTNHQLDTHQEWKQLQSILEALKLRATKIDPTLRASTEAVEVRLKRALDSLEKKLIRAEKRNFSEAMNDIEKVKQDLFPDGGLQERQENFGLFYVKYGDEFIQELIAHFKPLDFKFSVLY